VCKHFRWSDERIIFYGKQTGLGRVGPERFNQTIPRVGTVGTQEGRSTEQEYAGGLHDPKSKRLAEEEQDWWQQGLLNTRSKMTWSRAPVTLSWEPAAAVIGRLWRV
jgi:hypothetical protein